VVAADQNHNQNNINFRARVLNNTGFFMTVYIDLTTANTVYNPLGPQGSWIQHRFGRRNYPHLELDKNLVLSYLDQTDDIIFLTSSYGDPLCYSHIEDIIKSNKQFIIHSYLNIRNDKLFELLANSNSSVFVKLSGLDNIVDKIYLNSNWDIIKRNLSILKNKAVLEFELFEHNHHQIDNLLDLCQQLNTKVKITHGTSLNEIIVEDLVRGYSSIIDQRGDWLYDVVSINSPYPQEFCLPEQLSTIPKLILPQKDLVKSTRGFLTLRTFVKDKVGRTILEHPLIFKTESKKSFRPLTGYSISVTGHVFPNEEITKTFSNMLCSDWHINYKDVFMFQGKYTNEYLLEIVKLVNQINSLDLNKIHYSNSLRSVLSYLSDSDI
jgi:hypothetical protein